MREIRFEVIQGSDGGELRLRFYGPDGLLKDERKVDGDRVAALLERVARDYKQPFPKYLPTLGSEIYRFLDGQTHRWLSREREATRKSLMLRIDVAGRLAHLPWELLNDGARVEDASSRPRAPR